LTKSIATVPHPSAFLARIDFYRHDVSRRINKDHRARLGQFFTRAATARLMAAMFDNQPRSLRLLDAGAGVGSLTAAWIDALCKAKRRPRDVCVTAYEVDSELVPYLRQTLGECERLCEGVGITMSWEVFEEDFIEAGTAMLDGNIFAQHQSFTSAILNPPYRKIYGGSQLRQRLRKAGVDGANLYTAFLSIALRLLEPHGELVAISPRSFCNGPYYRQFRQDFLREMSLTRVHVFEARDDAFRDDDVLQENIIILP
jgi:adenine-specific DNA-methyltransferase